MNIRIFLLSAGVISLLLAACSDNGYDNPVTGNGGDGGTLPDTVSFAANVKPILSASCAVSGCHGTGSASGGLTMGSASYNSVHNASGSNGAIIDPGQSGSSNLYLKVTANPPFGNRMPNGRPALSSVQIQTIKKWIDQGALDN